MQPIRQDRRAANADRPNALDRAIEFVAPMTALRRMQARQAMALVGGYKGASRSRRALAEFNPGGGGPEADLNLDLPALRDRSRDLYRNAPIARGAVNEKVSIVVGAGHIVDPQIDRDRLGLSLGEAEDWEGQAAQIFRAHARSEDIHAGRTLNFAEMEALALQSVLLSGDVLIFERWKKRRGALFSTCFQLVEGDRLANPGGALDTQEISGGVKRDSDGEPIAYHVLDRHPGEWRTGSSLSGKWFDAFAADGQRRVRHLFFAKRPGQVRGEPFLAPVIESLKQLERYSDAELMAAVVNSCFAVTTKTDAGAGPDLVVAESKGGSGASEQKEINITEAGMIFDLAPDEDIASFTPGRPSASFDPFFRSVVSQLAVALDTTEEVLMRSFKASYSASRGAIEVAYRFAQSYEGWLIAKFCQPVYAAVIAEAVASGRLSAPGFFSDPMTRAAWLGASWTGPARISLNPKAESDADKQDLDMGLVSPYRLSAKRGLIFDAEAENRAKAKHLEERLGLGAASSPSVKTQPTDREPDDPNDDAADQDREDDDAAKR